MGALRIPTLRDPLNTARHANAGLLRGAVRHELNAWGLRNDYPMHRAGRLVRYALLTGALAWASVASANNRLEQSYKETPRVCAPAPYTER